MTTNSLGETTTQRRWTQTAIECYERGCTCEGCILNGVFESQEFNKCKMKATVLELVRVFGTPEGIKTKGLIDE